MVLDWKEDIEKFSPRRGTEQTDNHLTFIIAHEAYGKGAEKVTTWAHKLIGLLPRCYRDAEHEGDPDLHLKLHEKSGQWVHTLLPSGRYQIAAPQRGSSQFIIVTTTGSYDGHVEKYLQQRGPDYYTGDKQGKKNSGKLIPASCPAMVVVDEAHLVRREGAGHFAVVNGIQQNCRHILKTVWLTGTPFGKQPSDIAGMVVSMQAAGDWKEEPLSALSITAIRALDRQFTTLESRVKQKSITHRQGSREIDLLIGGIALALPQICVRHTTESTWFGKCLKKPIRGTDVDREVGFPAIYRAAYEQFDSNVKSQLLAEQRSLQENVRQGGEDAIVNSRKIYSMARMYRIASSLPFLVRFWNMPGMAGYQLTSREMDEWIEGDSLRTDCPLTPHIDSILRHSEKLEYIGQILDHWDESTDGKLLILSEFIVVAWFAAEVSLSFCSTGFTST